MCQGKGRYPAQMKPAVPLMGWCMSMRKVRAGECSAHLAANLHTHLLCHAPGYRDGSHTPGLCDSNAPTLQACTCQPKACQVVGQSMKMWAATQGGFLTCIAANHPGDARLQEELGQLCRLSTSCFSHQYRGIMRSDEL